MNAQRREAILIEILRQERFGRIVGTQCWAEGFCAALATELEGLLFDQDGAAKNLGILSNNSGVET